MLKNFFILFFINMTYLSNGAFEEYDLNNLLSVSSNDLLKIKKILDKKEVSQEEKSYLEEFKSSYSNNTYSKPKLENGFFEIKEIQYVKKFLKDAFHSIPTIHSVDKKWDIKEFDRVHTPVQISTVQDTVKFSKIGTPRCLHLPIKLPNSKIKVPNEYQIFQDTLKEIFQFEASINCNINEYYAYLTVDQRFVPAGESSRVYGCHVDGLPRNRANPNELEIDHSYIISDSIPTIFYAHTFPMKYFDIRAHHFWKIMDYFKDDSKQIKTIPYAINLMNAYSVHSSAISDQDAIRTFLRLEFSKLVFNREGNSVNPFLEYNWDYIPCHLPEKLTFPK